MPKKSEAAGAATPTASEFNYPTKGMNMANIATQSEFVTIPEIDPLKVAVSSIIVGDRHRKDMGDLQMLADSIKQIGLLQPVGVTADMVLIFGERRLRACRDILGWNEIPARVIDMPVLVVGEDAENRVRKDFTASERVAIAQAIIREFGDRRGVNQHTKHEERPGGDDPQGRTDAFAAKKAGFGGRRSYRDASYVVENAEPEVVAAMDTNVVSISAARKIADQEPETQREIIKSGRTWADVEREMEGEYRDLHANKHPELKTQTIIDCVMKIRACGMTPEEFRDKATKRGLERYDRCAPEVSAFIAASLTEGAA